MKKFLSVLFCFLIPSMNLSVCAADTLVKEAVNQEVTQDAAEAPVWSDYVPKKYETPAILQEENPLRNYPSVFF